MTTKLQNHVTEAVCLERVISEQTERRKTLKAQLVEAASEYEDELRPTESALRMGYATEERSAAIA